MDMDELDEKPKKAPARIPRFAPKSFRPKQKPLEDAPKSEPSASNGTVKMEVELKSEVVVDDDAPSLMDEEEPKDDEDEVVREIDVVFTPSIDSNAQLYVLQYPLRPRWRPYELDERCEEVRVKPVTAEVQVDLSLDINSKNYDQGSSRKLKMTKQTLSSSWIPPNVKDYAVGVLTGNKLHLNPVEAVVQLRPSLEYLDSDGSKRRADGAESTNLTVTTEEKADEKPIPSKKQNKKIESSVDLRADGGQCWVSLKYHNSNSDISRRYMERMTFQENNHLSFTMSPHDYLKSLCPGASSGNAKPRGPSKSFLLSLTLEDRLKTLLCEGPPVHRYSALKHFAPDHSDEEFLRVLEKHAWLVQGLWAPKSALVLPSGSHPQLLLGRDFALLLFSRNLKIGFSQLNVHRRLVPHVKEFLNSFGVERLSSRDWKFRVEPDTSFIARNPDVVKRQQLAFIQMEENISLHTQNKEGKGAIVRNSESKPKTGQSMVHDRGFGVSSKVPANRKTMSDETREALPKALHKLFQNHKVCSFQMICQGLRELAVSQSTLPKADARTFVAAANGVDDPPEELRAVISQIAVDIHGYYVLKSSPEHPEYDQLRDVVITLLQGKGPNGKLQKSEIALAVRTQLNREMANNEYNKVMNDFCTSKGSFWILRTTSGVNFK